MFNFKRLFTHNIKQNETYRPDNIPVIKDIEHSYLSNGILSHNTTTTVSFIVWYICFHFDKNVFVCAHKGKTGIEILKKSKEIIEDLPFFLKPGILNWAKERVSFENGNTIYTAAASESPATGDSINLLYIDECALIKENIVQEYWASVWPTMSSLMTAQCVISSTPRGMGNLFHQRWMDTMDPTTGWIGYRVDYWDVPGHDAAWAEDQLHQLGEEKFKREVELSFEVAGDRLVSMKAMDEMNKQKKKFIHRSFYSVPEEIAEKIIWDPDFDPSELSYYELKNMKFLLMIDTAQGIEAGATGKKDSDYNVINIFQINWLSPEQIELNRGCSTINIMDTVQFKQVGIYMDNRFNEGKCAEAAKYITFNIFKCGYEDIDNVRILFEVNFNGNNWLTIFMQHPTFYDSIILQTPNGQAKPGEQQKLMFGFRTSSGKHGKNYWCEMGSLMIDKKQIYLSQFDENMNLSTIGQLSQFCKKKRGTGYSYEGSCVHDDISVTCLFVSIASQSNAFQMWLTEWLENNVFGDPDIQKIQQMLDMYIDHEYQVTDEEFKTFFRAGNSGFGRLTHQQNGLGNLMNSNSNYYGLNTNSGWNNMKPRYR